MNKFNKKFASIQLSKVKVYCHPEVFALGCFFEPSMRQQKNLTTFLKKELGEKFSDYSVQKEIMWMCYNWFLPSIEYKSSRFHEVTNRFWKSNNAGTIAHKLPTLRDKDFVNELGISERNSRYKVQSLLSTKLIKTYIDEAKAINCKYSKIRFVQLNVPLMLSIVYGYDEIFSVYSFMGTRINEGRFFEDVINILSKALELSKP